MCTAVTYQTTNTYFGRNLDFEFAYNAEVAITPRNFPLHYRYQPTMEHHYAMIGVAFVNDNYPLYFDAMNEHGLGIAGLMFGGNAYYGKPVESKDNLASFELIPWILSQCTSTEEAKALFKTMNLTDDAFAPNLPPSELHWMVADRENHCLTVESMADGLHIYENDFGVLTNNPPYDEQRFRLNDFLALTNKDPENYFAPGYDLKRYSRGMGAMGLPGDLSSPSRYVRAVFTKVHSRSKETEAASLGQFFHILNNVAQPMGCCDLGNGNFEYTIYTSGYNLHKGNFYYTTYDNQQITGVSLHHEDLEKDTIVEYPFIMEEQIRFQNQ